MTGKSKKSKKRERPSQRKTQREEKRLLVFNMVQASKKKRPHPGKGGKKTESWFERKRGRVNT